MIFTRTGNSVEVKIEADSSDTTDDKPRTNIHTKRSLKDHKSTNDVEKQYRCTVCDKRFATKHYLTVHSRRHTGDHLYSCSQCAEARETGGQRGHVPPQLLPRGGTATPTFGPPLAIFTRCNSDGWCLLLFACYIFTV